MALRRSVLAAVLLLSCANVITASPEANPRALNQNLFGLLRRDLCTENDQVDCYNDCMPPDGNCCDDGSGTYCPSGEYCVPNGCCPNGEECSGGGGTITNDDLTGTGAFPTATAAVTTQQQTFVETPTTTFENGATNTAKATQTAGVSTATSTSTHTANAATGSTKTSTGGATVTVTQGASSGAGSFTPSIVERYALLLMTFAQWVLV